MPIRGHVDDMEGSYVVGWAAAVPDSGNCAITITDETGQLLAKGRASRHRPDLASLGLGRTTLAFRIAVPHAEAPRALRIFANGEELPGSPVATGPGLFDGHPWLEADTVSGWITERVTGFAAPFITVVNHLGVEVGRGQSQFETETVDPLFAPARFAIRLDDQCFGAGEMLLRVFADGKLFGHTSCNLGLNGNLEIVSATHVLGWLVSPEHPKRSFEVEVYRDGVLAGTAKCEHERLDVRGIYPECEAAGFDSWLDEPTHSATEAVTLSFRFAGSDRELFESPYVLAARPAAVAAIYDAARLTNMGLPGVTAAARAVLGQALREYLARVRTDDGFTLNRQALAAPPAGPRPRLAIIIPIYRGVEITQACIHSVLLHRDPADLLILINDASPDAAMAGMLAPYGGIDNVILLTNGENLGFVRTVNRGMTLAQGTDVVLLNSDTVMHAGGLDELLHVAQAHPEIGTVTAISNNATIFSYPHTELRQPALADIGWPELAAVALAENAGLCVDVPTGHGFCMLVKAEVIRRIGLLDEGFGRGYGEENDLCARTAALGYRNVAAGGVLVEHKESISFANERASLLAQNLPRLTALYPEYTPIIMEFERVDGMRKLRWALDRARLIRARAAGKRFVLVVANALEGGTPKAINDIERNIGYGGAEPLTLRVTKTGLLELDCAEPLLRASFTTGETAELLDVLDAAAPGHVLVHQILGFPLSFVTAFQPWLAGRHSVFWAHDFYPLCPRVTMIDAIGRFCGGADAETCARCVEMGGAHDSSMLTDLTPAEHRALFTRLLSTFTHVLAPSANAATYFSRIFPGIGITVQPHPESAKGIATQPRAGSDDEIVLLGAIGPHKGSGTLLEIARRARLTHPHLHFRVIGYTDIDKQLKAVGNVTITGKYKPEELARHLREAKGRLGLFLPAWPETYSYTLSELVGHGFIPMVPDIGAPAERVRAAKYGVVFPFPADAEAVLKLIDGIAAGEVKPYAKGATPARFFPGTETRKALAAILGLTAPAAAKEPAA
jgi:GT2 family glycosyltransferase/glycosyltransferase involved in cell wall biosynthesis